MSSHKLSATCNTRMVARRSSQACDRNGTTCLHAACRTGAMLHARTRGNTCEESDCGRLV
eukprot:533068-Amphidinium_carterae.1